MSSKKPMTDSRTTISGQLYPLIQRNQDGRSDQQAKRRADTPQPSFLRRLLNIWLRPPGAPALRHRSPPAQEDFKQRSVIRRQVVANSYKSRKDARSVSFNEGGTRVQLQKQTRNWTNGSQTLPHRPKPTAAVSSTVAIVPFTTTIASATTCSAYCCHITTSTRRRVSATNKPSTNMMPARSTPNLMPNKINVGNQQYQHNAVLHHQGQSQRLQKGASNKKPTANIVGNQRQEYAPAQMEQEQQTLYNAYLGHLKNIPPPLPPTLSRDVSTTFLGGGGTAIRRDGDDESPPPTPPVRDSSSLKNVKYGPGHEKFPSWPVPATADTPAALRTPPGGGSHRSKSWTDHTNYPKEQPLTYTRPYMKRQHSSQTQQKLKTVLEKCEKIPAEVYDSSKSSHRYHNIVDGHGPMIAERGPKYAVAQRNRDGKIPGDLHYIVPSPPERDLNHATNTVVNIISVANNNMGQNNSVVPACRDNSPTKPQPSPPPLCPLSPPPPIPPYNQQKQPSYATNISADNSNYEDTYSHSILSSYNGTDQGNSMRIDDDDDDSVTLRNGGRGMGGDLDNGELNSLLLLSAMNHQKQVSYAQSEGYHSYVSSTDSTGTPFLDRLRRDSEATPTSSSAPTHALHHPVSLLPTSHHTSINSPSAGQHPDYRDTNNGTISRCSTTMSRSVSVIGASGGGRDSVVTTSSGSASSSETLKWHGSMSDVSSIAGSFTTNHSTISSTSSTNCSSTSPLAINQRQHRSHNIAHSARVKTPQRHHSESVLYIQQAQQQQLGTNGQQHEQLLMEQQQWRERELRNNGRNNRELKLFAVNTYTVEERGVEKERREVGEMVQQIGTTIGQHTRVPSNVDSSSSGANNTTVADRVNEFEKQQRYSYLDPDKRHKIPDPTLKAIQKKALLSFYERRHSASNRKANVNAISEVNGSGGSNNWRSEPQLNGAVLSSVATFTVPMLPARRTAQLPSRRASSASDYSNRSSLIVNKELGHQSHSPTTSPKHSPPTLHSPKSLTKSASKRSSLSDNLPSSTGGKLTIKHQHSNSCGSLSTNLLGPVILGPSISLDDWIPEQPPERPPKNPALLKAYLTPKTIAKQSHDSFSNYIAVTKVHAQSSVNNLTVLANSSWANRLDVQKSDGVSSSSEDDDLILPPPPPISNSEDDLDSDLPLPPPPSDLLETELVFKAERSCGAVAGAQVENGKNTGSGNTKANSTTALINQTIGLPEPPYLLPPRSDKINTPLGHSPCNFTSSSNIRQRYSPPSQKPTQSAILTTPINCQPLNRTSATSMYNCDRVVPNRNDKQPKDGIAKSDNSAGLRSQIDNTMSTRQSSMQRASIAIATSFDCDHRSSGRVNSFDISPPPLQPRQVRANQSMRANITEQKAIGASRASPKAKRSAQKDSSKSKEQGKDVIMTPSKASYLASRRDRERIVPDSDTGVYKRTISPNGHVISPDSFNESPKMINTRETHWPNSNRIPKDAPATVNHKNHVNILRRVSMSEKGNKGDNIECLEAGDQIKPQLALPDVLPVNAKLLGPRLMSRPSQLSLVPSENDLLQLSPIATPPSSPPRQSLFTPLRNTALSTTQPLRTSSIRTSPPSKIYSSTYEQPDKISSPPQIRPPLSPNSPKKLSPITRLSPNVPVKVTTPIIMPSSPKRTLSTRSSFELNSPKSLTPPDSPPVHSAKVAEGLQLIQRTEVVLRVNATTTDAASQTEKVDEDAAVNSTYIGTSPTAVPTRKKLQEEIECELLSQEFVQELIMPTCDRLKGLLVPGPEHKKSTDYVTGLYRVDVTLRPRPANSPFRSKATTPSNSPPPNNNASNSTVTAATSISTATQATNHSTNNNSESSLAVPTQLESVSPLSASSAYFTTSEPKAKLLTRYSHDLNQFNVIKDTKDLSRKKEELVARLDRKLSVLRCEHLVVQEECRVNDSLGEEVRAHVCTVARPHEAAKVRLHVDEVGRITSLLLGLSGRLARAENALMRLTDGPEEKAILLTKRDKLREQLDEAKQLKTCIDKRAVSVSNILYKYLTADEYADYDHYINMKAKLIMDAKEIVDNIQLGEEQLSALQETLIVAE